MTFRKGAYLATLLLLADFEMVFADTISPIPAEALQKHDAADEVNPYRAWYFVWGGTNVYPGLNTSEKFINQRMNLPLGLLFWDWDRPTTFRDWRNAGFLWEPYIGIMKGLDRHFMLFLTGGTIGGSIHNNTKNHLLVVPMQTKITFSRFAVYGTIGLDYYPLERPDPDELPEKFSPKLTLTHSKPFLALGVSYMRQTEIGSAAVDLPGVGRIFKQREKFVYDFGHVSTRLGLELPLTKNDSITISGGYAFCYPHSEEFSGPTFGIFHMHRF